MLRVVQSQILRRGGALRCLCSSQGQPDVKIDEHLQARLNTLKSNLEEALESVKYIGESSEQAFLETDPTNRRPKEAYFVRYATWAHDGIDRALVDYHALREQLGGPEVVAMVAQMGFGNTLADCMVQRAALRQCVGRAEQVLRQLDGDDAQGNEQDRT